MSDFHWGYTATNGPDCWPDHFSVAKGTRQSPIDIVTSSANYDNALEGSSPLVVNYTPEPALTIANNGHSIQASIQKESFLSGGPLEGQYQLAQFHLHWGASADKGSEHTIDGEKYAAELHLVHFNVGKYKTIGEAVDKPDGLAVLGIMIKEGDGTNNFGAISGQLDDLKEVKSETTIKGAFDPKVLLPAGGKIDQYWTYLGSLTTPPLLESVTWIVLKEPVQYSTEQMQKLRSLNSSDGTCMIDNYRPPQPIGERQLRKSFE